MINNTLTQNQGKLNLDRDSFIYKLRQQGFTYEAIGKMFNPPVKRQTIHIAIKRFLRRRDKKASA